MKVIPPSGSGKALGTFTPGECFMVTASSVHVHMVIQDPGTTGKEAEVKTVNLTDGKTCIRMAANKVLPVSMTCVEARA